MSTARPRRKKFFTALINFEASTGVFIKGKKYPTGGEYYGSTGSRCVELIHPAGAKAFFTEREVKGRFRLPKLTAKELNTVTIL